MRDNKFYTYLWLRVDGTPYYVGKGKGKRGLATEDHCVKCPKDASRIIIQDHPSEVEALEVEVFFISFYGRKDLGTGCLRNLTDGGEGISGYKHKKETTERMSKSHSGVPKSSIHRKNMSLARKHWWEEHPEEKHKRSKEFLAMRNLKITATKLREIWDSPEYRSTQAQITRENWKDLRYRSIVCQAMRKPRSEDGRKNMRAGKLSKSPEERFEIGKKVWESRRRNAEIRLKKEAA